jgi:hypothetical protein
VPLIRHRQQVLDLLPRDQGQGTVLDTGVQDGRRRRVFAGCRTPESTHARLLQQLEHGGVVDVIERVEITPSQVDGDVQAAAGSVEPGRRVAGVSHA